MYGLNKLALFNQISRRMQNFEQELCTTVDAILNILGHKPMMTKDVLDQIAPVSPVKSQRPFRSKSSRPVKPHSDIELTV